MFPGARVLEAGAGSGALTCSLLRAVGTPGRVVSYERRAGPRRGRADATSSGSSAARTRQLGAARRRHGRAPGEGSTGSCWTCSRRGRCCRTVARGAGARRGADRCTSPTDTQLSRIAEDAARSTAASPSRRPGRRCIGPGTLVGLAVRPEHRMVGHTAFLVSARRLAPGVTAAAPGSAGRRRPAAGEGAEGGPSRPRSEQFSRPSQWRSAAAGDPPAARRQDATRPRGTAWPSGRPGGPPRPSIPPLTCRFASRSGRSRRRRAPRAGDRPGGSGHGRRRRLRSPAHGGLAGAGMAGTRDRVRAGSSGSVANRLSVGPAVQGDFDRRLPQEVVIVASDSDDQEIRASRYEKDVHELTTQVSFLEEEVSMLRRRLTESPRTCGCSRSGSPRPRAGLRRSPSGTRN